MGWAAFTDKEVENLRAYLMKGGFLWADDFWGEYAWEVWAEQIDKAGIKTSIGIQRSGLSATSRSG